MLKGFGKTIQRMVADAVAADLAKKLFGDVGKGGGSGGGSGGSAGWIQAIAGLFGFADGGVMTSKGPLPLRSYARGGIASSPQAAIYAEGDMNEAFVPLPDGRSIPVKMQGGGGSTIILNVSVNGSNNAPDVRRAAGQGAREALGLLSGAQRYA